MLTITLKFYNVGRRWFSGKKMNQGFTTDSFPRIFHKGGLKRTESQYDENIDSERDEDNIDYCPI